MFFLEEIAFCIVFLLFPILAYIIYLANNNNLNKSKSELLLDIANLSSIYMLIRYQTVYNNSIYLVLFINIPLIISLINKRYATSLFLSLIIVCYYYFQYHIYLPFLLIEYLIYNMIFIFNKFNNKDYEKVLNIFGFLKGIILSIVAIYIFPADNNIIVIIGKIFLILLIFYLVSFLVFKLLAKAKNIISLNCTLKELEKEKLLKNTLFQIIHEIKNPLAVCKGYLSMLDYDNLTNLKRYNQIIESEVNRTLGLMEDFNDYTKIKINKEDMDIILLLQETIDSTKTLVAEKDIIFEYQLPDDEIYIKADYSRLKQVLVNIIKNSYEAITNKGVIKISLEEQEDNISIEISDNGKGMSKETLKNMGKMFYTTKQNGTGIGVALSYEIIKQHKGTISYQLTEENGVKVNIILPKE